MAVRNFRIYLMNETQFKLSVVGGTTLDHGEWTDPWQPPATILPGKTGAWQSESDGLATGTEGHISFEIQDRDQLIGDDKHFGKGDRIYIHWDNPYFDPLGSGTSADGKFFVSSTFENYVEGKSNDYKLLYSGPHTFDDLGPGPVVTEGWLEVVPGFIGLPIPNVGVIDHAWAAFSLRFAPQSLAVGKAGGALTSGGVPLKGGIHNGVFLQGSFGKQGNFEAVVIQGDKISHCYRDNDAPGAPWHGPFRIFEWRSSSPSGNVGQIPAFPKAVSLIQSNFVSPGNLEAVVRVSPTLGDDKLAFIFRDQIGWHGPFDLVADGKSITGVSGNPALIQGHFGKRGNFELLVPMGNKLVHLYRDNDDPKAPWHGPFVVFEWKASQPAGGNVAIPSFPTAVALLESNFANPGNLECVVRVSPTIGDDKLVFFYRDGGGWHGPSDIIADGKPITGITGQPAMIQSAYGRQGNFELLVPLGNKLVHYFRDNDSPGAPWHGPLVVFEWKASSAGNVGQIPSFPTAVSLIESNFGDPGNLEAMVRVSPTIGEDKLVFFFRDRTGWHGPSDIAADGALIGGVTGF